MSLAPSAETGSPVLGLRTRAAPGLYAATLFLSALLLFSVQPLFAKMVLPRLGGASAVWSVAMVFFQTALLVGYAYAHLTARMLSRTTGAFLHLALLALAALTLPLAVAQGFGAAPASRVEIWLFALFAASIGLPFVALAASAPLLQSWFAGSGHPHAGNPYVLYAASNLGSFAALLAYPFAIEPLVSLQTQVLAWSVGYAGLSILVACAAILVIGQRDAVAAPTLRGEAPASSLPDRLAWILLSAIPAGLVVAVTAVLTTDVASAPFLWVIPLAIYLLTFVAVFRTRPWFRHETIVMLVPFAAVAMIATGIAVVRTMWLGSLLCHLVGFAILALACHGELYRRRPPPARLTEFYLWNSLGGVAGGAFAGLLAPHAFNGTIEYPLLILAALMAMPGVFAGGPATFARKAGPILLLAGLATTALMFQIRLPGPVLLPFHIAMIVLMGVLLLLRQKPAQFFALAAVAAALVGLEPGLTRIEQVRSFFGVHRVVETFDQTHRLLLHGTTLHGAERVRHEDGTPVTGRPEPLTYYYFGGPIDEAISASRKAQGGLANVAAVGLGTGSLACHRRAGEAWTIFELDPHVVRIARDPMLFRFLSECGADIPIVIGDARLTLTNASQTFNVIVLDAFSSDSIPVHLLTREALEGYLSRLSADGAIVLHISNRHMKLQRPVAALAAALGLQAYGKRDYREVGDADMRLQAEVAILTRDQRTITQLETQGWKSLDAAGQAPWTDDYADVLSAILTHKLKR